MTKIKIFQAYFHTPGDMCHYGGVQIIARSYDQAWAKLATLNRYVSLENVYLETRKHFQRNNDVVAA